jgi:hypothetical protein
MSWVLIYLITGGITAALWALCYILAEHEDPSVRQVLLAVAVWPLVLVRLLQIARG